MPAASESDPRRLPAGLLAAITAAYTLVLVVATHYPKPERLLGPNPPSDKTLHLLAYGLLGLLVAATLVLAGLASRRNLLVAIVVVAIFAVVDEITQPLFGRQAEIRDWFFDVIGLTAGVAFVAVACGRRPPRQPPDGQRQASGQ